MSLVSISSACFPLGFQKVKRPTNLILLPMKCQMLKVGNWWVFMKKNCHSNLWLTEKLFNYSRIKTRKIRILWSVTALTESVAESSCFFCRFWDPWCRSREVDDSWGDCTIYCRQERCLWITCSMVHYKGKSMQVLTSFCFFPQLQCNFIPLLQVTSTGSSCIAENVCHFWRLLFTRAWLASISPVWLYLNVHWERKDYVNFIVFQLQPVMIIWFQ